MPFNPRAAQELDLLLQEGQADNPLLTEGLVRLYANELFRFAWVIYALEADNRTVQRLLARRAVGQALTTALRQLRRFQEQPDTFLWLLALTNPSSPHPLLAAYLHTRLNLSPEDIAYVLKIPTKRAATLVDADSTLSLPPTHPKLWNFAGERAPLITLTQEEISSLIEQVQPASNSPPRAGFVPRFFREIAFIGLALLIFIALARAAPQTVFTLPTPIPTATPVGPLTSDWEATPQVLPTAVQQLPSDIFYVPKNPYLIWQRTQTLQQNTDSITALAFSPIEPILAVGTNENTVMLWDTTTFTLLKTLEGQTGAIKRLAFSPDGALIASANTDGTVRLWEIPSGFLVQVLDGHPKLINGLTFSPDGGTLAVTAGKELWLWQVDAGIKIASYAPFDRILNGITYSPDGKYLAVEETNGTGWVLRARDAFPLLSFKNQNYSSIDGPMRFSPDGNYLLSISNQNELMIISLKGDTTHLEGEVVKTLFHMDENSYTPTLEDFMFSNDGKFFVVATMDGSIGIFDTETWTAVQAPLTRYDYGASTRYLALSYDNRMIAVSRLEGEVDLWQLQDVSAQVNKLPEPRYFERLKTDIYQWTYVYPEEMPSFFAENNRLSVEAASAEAGFPVKIPFFGLLGGDHQFDGVYYDPNYHLIYTSVWANNDPGLLWGFTLYQRRVEPGKLMGLEVVFVLGSDVIGASAFAEPLEIGELYGELILGDWVFLPEENLGTYNEAPQPGSSIDLVNRWSSDGGNVKLRWMDGDILYEMDAYVDWLNTDTTSLQNTLITLASSMFSPEQINLPWNARLYSYPVQTGDTCSALAERFFTTVDTILHLNGLLEDCSLVPGQTILLPYPNEPIVTTDLNCDGLEETVLLRHDVHDPGLILGVAVNAFSESNIQYQVWDPSAFQAGISNIRPLELFSVGECEQLIALSAGTPTAGRTRIFRWDGSSIWPVMNAPGWPASPNGLVASLPQSPDSPFVISMIQYVPNVHPAAGPCPNQVMDYTWNGNRFEAGETRLVLGECERAVP